MGRAPDIAGIQNHPAIGWMWHHQINRLTYSGQDALAQDVKAAVQIETKSLYAHLACHLDPVPEPTMGSTKVPGRSCSKSDL